MLSPAAESVHWATFLSVLQASVNKTAEYYLQASSPDQVVFMHLLPVSPLDHSTSPMLSCVRDGKTETQRS